MSVEQELAAEIAERGFAPDAAQRQAARELDRIREHLLKFPRRYGFWRHRAVRWFPARAALQPAPGLYLWGDVGRGKTHLMDLFYDSLPFAERQRSHFYRFMHDVHSALRSVHMSANPLEVVAHRIAKRARIICFDEFFVADIADAMILAGLFAGLFRRGVTLVATSNFPPQELYKGGLQRQRFLPTIDLIQKHAAVLRVDGGVDYRLRQLEREGTFVDSCLPDAERRLAAYFERLAAQAGATDVTLDIAGRPIQAKRENDGIVWFDFKELCEGPRSQADYIEIAHEYHTVFLSGVPPFSASDDDAARRFIMLIDELYDRAVKLIVSAAAEPHDLYRGDRLRFEFERAASRLIEMRSHTYLARAHRA